MDNRQIADKVRKLRVSFNLSQEQMAELMGIGRTTFINFENGRTRAVSKNVFKFAKALGMTPEQIILDSDYRERLSGELNEGPSVEEVRKTLSDQFYKELDNKDLCIAHLTEALSATKKALDSSAEAINSLKEQVSMLQAKVASLEEAR